MPKLPIPPVFLVIAGAAGGALAGRLVRPYAYQFVGGQSDSDTEEASSASMDEEPGDITLMMDLRGAMIGGGIAMALRPFLGDFPKILMTLAFIIAFTYNASRGTKYQEDVDKTVGKVAPAGVESLVG